MAIKDLFSNPLESAGSFIANSFSPAATRQFFSGLPFGATRETGDVNRKVVFQGLGASDDWRVRIKVPPRGNFHLAGLLSPLQSTNGVLFPYTPDITVNHVADYEPVHPTHTNFASWSYKNSKIDTISIAADFTASSPSEASYVLAMMHFFKSVTKMFYGQDANAGSPPPILLLNGYGPDMFHDVPVVVSNFTCPLSKDIDYISAPLTQNIQSMQQGQPDTRYLENGILWNKPTAALPTQQSIVWNTPTSTQQPTRVPTNVQISLTLNVIYSRNKIANRFSLEKFASGSLDKEGFI